MITNNCKHRNGHRLFVNVCASESKYFEIVVGQTEKVKWFYVKRKFNWNVSYKQIRNRPPTMRHANIEMVVGLYAFKYIQHSKIMSSKQYGWPVKWFCWRKSIVKKHMRLLIKRWILEIHILKMCNCISQMCCDPIPTNMILNGRAKYFVLSLIILLMPTAINGWCLFRNSCPNHKINK